jgi:pyruvate kinase
MKIKRKKLTVLLEQLESIKKEAFAFESKYAEHLSNIHPSNAESARNLVHYLALRNQDIRELQNSLWELGISRLGRAESHVMASIISVENLLKSLLYDDEFETEKPFISFKKGRKLLKSHTIDLFGNKLKGSKVRIMVTFPAAAAEDYKLVKNLFKSGMNSARINCAHDTPEVWSKMIKGINRAKKLTGRGCKICMDLGGPKLRTGTMRLGPKAVHLIPERDLLGNVIAPAEAWLVPEGFIPEMDDDILIPVPADFLKTVKAGNELTFRDTRGKEKKLITGRKAADRRLVKCYESAYIKTGTEFTRLSDGASVKAGELMPLEESILLKAGDKLIIHKDTIPGEPAEYSSSGELIKPAHISCTLPEIFNDIKKGELIILDDGKIEGTINKVEKDNIEVIITYAKEEGSKLKGDKGINLPVSNLTVKGLTSKDKEDLKFICRHADIVNYSFVNSPEDVSDIFNELKANNSEHIGIIFKIETRKAFENLPAILLTAMQHHPVGVMIARGDLAIECGWNELARIQEEILWICEAAHIPIVWATQVLETMAKKGRPSRAEITDAALAEQAECVMLNKGPYIFEAIEILDTIVSSMQEYHYKKAPLLPPLKIVKI